MTKNISLPWNLKVLKVFYLNFLKISIWVSLFVPFTPQLLRQKKTIESEIISINKKIAEKLKKEKVNEFQQNSQMLEMQDFNPAYQYEPQIQQPIENNQQKIILFGGALLFLLLLMKKK